MKVLILALSLLSSSVFAGSFYCVSDDDKFEIKATYDMFDQNIEEMTYSYKGKDPFVTFKNVPFSVDRLYGKTHEMDVYFGQAFRYLVIKRKTIAKSGAWEKTGSGRFIVRNNLFSPEYLIDCEFND